MKVTQQHKRGLCEAMMYLEAIDSDDDDLPCSQQDLADCAHIIIQDVWLDMCGRPPAEKPIDIEEMLATVRMHFTLAAVK